MSEPVSEGEEDGAVYVGRSSFKMKAAVRATPPSMRLAADWMSSNVTTGVDGKELDRLNELNRLNKLNG